MWTQDLVRDLVWTRVHDAVTAGTSATTSSIVDMQDYDGIAFITSLSGVLNTSVVTSEISENSANQTSGMTAIASSLATYTNSSGSTQKGLIVSQIYRPLLRYCEVVVTPGTANAAIDVIMAVQWRGRVEPANLLTNWLAYATAAGV